MFELSELQIDTNQKFVNLKQNFRSFAAVNMMKFSVIFIFFLPFFSTFIFLSLILLSFVKLVYDKSKYEPLISKPYLII